MSDWIPQPDQPSLAAVERAADATCGAGFLPGGLPVTSTRGLHAAIGASGGDRDGDIACAEAARTSLLNTLPE